MAAAARTVYTPKTVAVLIVCRSFERGSSMPVVCNLLTGIESRYCFEKDDDSARNKKIDECQSFPTDESEQHLTLAKQIARQRARDISKTYQIPIHYTQLEYKDGAYHWNFVVKTNTSSFGIIKGTVEDGEEPKQALVREIQEEVGVTVPEDRLLLCSKWKPFLREQLRNIRYQNEKDKIIKLIEKNQVYILYISEEEQYEITKKINNRQLLLCGELFNLEFRSITIKKLEDLAPYQDKVMTQPFPQVISAPLPVEKSTEKFGVNNLSKYAVMLLKQDKVEKSLTTKGCTINSSSPLALTEESLQLKATTVAGTEWNKSIFALPTLTALPAAAASRQLRLVARAERVPSGLQAKIVMSPSDTRELRVVSLSPSAEKVPSGLQEVFAVKAQDVMPGACFVTVLPIRESPRHPDIIPEIAIQEYPMPTIDPESLKKFTREELDNMPSEEAARGILSESEFIHYAEIQFNTPQELASFVQTNDEYMSTINPEEGNLYGPYIRRRYSTRTNPHVLLFKGQEYFFKDYMYGKKKRTKKTRTKKTRTKKTRTIKKRTMRIKK